jgi:hypothetical protein
MLYGNYTRIGRSGRNCVLMAIYEDTVEVAGKITDAEDAFH